MRTLLAFILLCSTAHAYDKRVNPGQFGANALPTFAAELPWASEYTLATVGVAYQQGRLDDRSFTPTFRLSAPFTKWVTVVFEGAPLEVWWASPRTAAEWQLTSTQGVSKADIRFGVKFSLIDFGASKPKIAFRAVTKTTTGKSFEERRFINAPGYLLDGIIGQRFIVNPNLVIDLFATGGFFAWQQGSNGQNDAVHVALALAVRIGNRLDLEWQGRAYFGWQRNADTPIVSSLRVGIELASFCQLSGTLNLGFLDAPRVEARLDATFRLPAVLPLLL
jgi:hypothetical protein